MLGAPGGRGLNYPGRVGTLSCYPQYRDGRRGERLYVRQSVEREIWNDWTPCEIIHESYQVKCALHEDS